MKLKMVVMVLIVLLLALCEGCAPSSVNAVFLMKQEQLLLQKHFDVQRKQTIELCDKLEEAVLNEIEMALEWELETQIAATESKTLDAPAILALIAEYKASRQTNLALIREFRLGAQKMVDDQEKILLIHDKLLGFYARQAQERQEVLDGINNLLDLTGLKIQTEVEPTPQIGENDE